MTNDQFNFIVKIATQRVGPVLIDAARQVIIHQQPQYIISRHYEVSPVSLEALVNRIRAKHEEILALYGLSPETIQLRDIVMQQPRSCKRSILDLM